MISFAILILRSHCPGIKFYQTSCCMHLLRQAKTQMRHFRRLLVPGPCPSISSGGADLRSTSTVALEEVLEDISQGEQKPHFVPRVSLYVKSVLADLRASYNCSTGACWVLFFHRIPPTETILRLNPPNCIPATKFFFVTAAARLMHHQWLLLGNSWPYWWPLMLCPLWIQVKSFQGHHREPGWKSSPKYYVKCSEDKGPAVASGICMSH